MHYLLIYFSSKTQQMSRTNEEKNRTAHFMMGRWRSNGLDHDISIEITPSLITVEGTFEDDPIEATFEKATSWWVETFLLFTSDPRFYIHYATEEHLAFGEMEIPGDLGEIKWSYRFNRVG